MATRETVSVHVPESFANFLSNFNLGGRHSLPGILAGVALDRFAADAVNNPDVLHSLRADLAAQFEVANKIPKGTNAMEAGELIKKAKALYRTVEALDAYLSPAPVDTDVPE